MAVTIHDPEISLSLLVGNGDGSFRPAVDFANTTGLDSPAVAAADLDNDGNLDAVVAHSIACFRALCVVGETLSVMLGNGDGTFQPTRNIQVGRGMSRIAVGDFNRDGVKDLGIGLLNSSAQLGGAVGVAVLAAIATNRGADALASGATPVAAQVEGFQLAFVIAAAISLAGAIVAALTLEQAKPSGLSLPATPAQTSVES